jgi:ABC-2 type transport system permease protein
MLTRHYAKQETKGLIGWAVGILALVWVSTAFFRVLENGPLLEFNQLLKDLPGPMKSLLGGQITTIDGYLLMEIFILLAPMVLLIYTATAVTGIVTKEADAGTLAFLLALPVSRSRLLLTRLGVFVGNLAILHAVLFSAVLLGVVMIGEHPNGLGYLLACINLFAINLALTGILLCLSLFVDDGPMALTLTLGTGVSLWLLPSLISASSSLSWLRWLSVFLLYHPNEAVNAHQLQGGAMAGAVVIAALFFAGAVIGFGRKQVTG